MEDHHRKRRRALLAVQHRSRPRPLMSKGTPHRPIRIADGLWAAVRAKATAEGTTASEVIRRLLTEWIGK